MDTFCNSFSVLQEKLVKMNAFKLKSTVLDRLRSSREAKELFVRAHGTLRRSYLWLPTWRRCERGVTFHCSQKRFHALNRCDIVDLNSKEKRSSYITCISYRYNWKSFYLKANIEHHDRENTALPPDYSRIKSIRPFSNDK